MTLSCPACHGTHIIMKQYRGTTEDYDGVSELACVTCGTRWGRWTGKILAGDEIEPRYGVSRDQAPLRQG